MENLKPLADIGINLLEIMPVGDFPGRFGWGYDGVDLWAPTRLYGSPDDFRAFVDTAHSLRLGVILDVVYNHFGSEREKHAEAFALHRDLLRFRRDFSKVDGAVIGEEAFLLRFNDDRLLIINLGAELTLQVAPEPLLVPPRGGRWQLLLSSEAIAGVEFEGTPSWRIPAEAAVLLERTAD